MIVRSRTAFAFAFVVGLTAVVVVMLTAWPRLPTAAGRAERAVELDYRFDIRLPQSKTGPVNYSIYPHVEVDGTVFQNVETAFSFRDQPPMEAAHAPAAHVSPLAAAVVSDGRGSVR